VNTDQKKGMNRVDFPRISPDRSPIFHSLVVCRSCLYNGFLAGEIGNLIKGYFKYSDCMAADSPASDQPKKHVWLKNLYLISRILVVIAIIGMIITSVMVIITAFAEVFRIISFFMHEGMLSEEAGTFLSVNVTEMIDLYLIGLVLIIMSLGLYQLFIDPDVDLPEWLDTPSFDILKARLLIVVVVVLPVMFLGYAATATDGAFIAGLGIAISLVMIAIGYIISIASKGQIERKRLEIMGSERKK
jgi:uncharacterized membrane protein YqhA